MSTSLAPFWFLVWCSFLIGFSNIFTDFAWRADMKTLGVDIGATQVFMNIAGIPWMIKALFGLISDRLSICKGYHRQPYFVTSYVLAAACFFSLVMQPLDVNVYVTASFFCQLFVAWGDVIVDSVIVEETRKEPLDKKGTTANKFTIARSIGTGTASIVAGLVFDSAGARVVFLIQAIMLLIHGLLGFAFFSEIPRPYLRVNPQDNSVPLTHSIMGIIQGCFFMLTDPVYSRMLAYYILVSLMPNPGLALFYYALDKLDFSATTIAALRLSTELARVGAIMSFEWVIRGSPLRSLYTLIQSWEIISTIVPIGIVNGFFASYGLPPELAYGFDDALGEILEEYRYRPISILSQVAPPLHMEAACYQITLSTINFFGSARSLIEYAFMTSVFQVTHGQWDGLLPFIVTCTLFKATIPFILSALLLPSNTMETVSEGLDQHRRQLPNKRAAVAPIPIAVAVETSPEPPSDAFDPDDDIESVNLN